MTKMSNRQERRLPTGIYQQPSGRYRIGVAEGRGGKTRWYNGFEHVDDAQEFRAACLRANRRGEPHPPRPDGPSLSAPSALTDAATFGAVAESWLTERSGRLLQSTVNDYRSLIRRRLLPTFGTRHVASVTRQEITEFLDDLTSTVSDRQLELLLWTINSIFEHATLSNVTQHLPTLKLKPPKSKCTTPARADTPFSVTEVQTIASYFPPHMRLLPWLGFLGGVRIGEALGLRIGDYKPNEREIVLSHIAGSNIAPLDGSEDRVRHRVGLKGTHRGEKPRQRTIRIPDALCGLIEEHLRRFRATASEDDPVIATLAGGVHYQSTTGEMLNLALQKAGVTDESKGGEITFHLFRKTCATVLYDDASVRGRAISHYLGHRAAAGEVKDHDVTSPVTEQVYLLLSETQHAAPAAALDRAISVLPGPLVDFEPRKHQTRPTRSRITIPEAADAPEGTNLMTSEELAAVLGCRPQTVAGWIRSGHLPGYRRRITAGKNEWLTIRDGELIERCREYWSGPAGTVPAVEAARSLGVGSPRVVRLIADGKLEVVHPRLPNGSAKRRAYVTVESLIAEMRRRGMPTPASLLPVDLTEADAA